jgi:two-component system sensor histidine kinase MprB
MTFRTRLAMVAAIAVAVAVAVASAIVYVVVRNELRSQVDETLHERVEEISHVPISVLESSTGEYFVRLPRPFLGGPAGVVQVVTSEGETIRPPEESVQIPVDDRAREVAAGRRDAFFADAQAADTHVRVLTVPAAEGFAIQVAGSLAEVDDTLARLRSFLLVIALGGIAIAAALGLVVAQTALAPVRRLTEATEHVTETKDLSRRMDTPGRDELSRLAASFNTMLEALEQSLEAQRQLVADASHELRTPLTSLRTNIEVLARANELPADERERLLADVVEQLHEMSTLVAELVELARGEQRVGEPEEIRLDLLVGETVERAQRHANGIEFALDAEETTVRGVRSTIERAVSNLLDNAAKWSPPGGTVEVYVEDGQVLVRDHGPGIDDEDLPHVFDRFYRAAGARGLPGSGLGLAIVRQVAEAHGGAVSAERAAGGGTRVRLRLGPAEQPQPIS